MGRKKHKPPSPSYKHPEETKSRDTTASANDCQNEINKEHDRYKTRATETNKGPVMAGKQNTEFIHVDGNEDSVFPRYFYWIVFLWTVVIRLWYVVTPTNWWILHPDEVYQTVEVAHSEVFGYGFRPYEYLPPPGNVTYSDEHAQTIELGMYSLRSFLLVKLLSIPLTVADILGISASPFLVTKVVHAVVTSFLPVSVFKFCSALSWPRDVATLAAILTSFSLTLNVLGTHTLINSFISPVLFFSLTPLASAISFQKVNLRNKQKQNETEIRFSKDKTTNSGHLTMTNGTVTSHSGYRNGHINQNVYRESNGYINIANGKLNGHANGVTHCKNEPVWNLDGIFGKFDIFKTFCEDQRNKKRPNNKVQQYGNGHLNGYLVGDINANIVKKHHKCNGNTETNRKPSVRTANTSEPKDPRHELSGSNTLLLGMFLGTCVYIRTDVILIPAVISITFIDIIVLNINRVVHDLVEYAIGFALAILIGGYVDSGTYGVWFISIKQWFNFNIVNSFSAYLFGDKSYGFYFQKLVEHEPLAVAGLSLLVFDVLVSGVLYVSGKSKSTSSANVISRNTSFAFVILLCIYSFIAHKEVRFMHNGIVLLYISLARAVYNLCKFCLSSIENQSRFQYYTCIYSISTLILSSHIYSFINMGAGNISKWTYGGIVDADTNICIDFIRRQDDVNGVMMDRSLFSSGGYSALHKDVSIFSLNKYEFVEYDKESRVTDSRFFSHNLRVGFSTIGRVSEFVSTLNTPYVVKVLISKPQYNYVILESRRRFIDIGFIEVFRTATSRVLKRSFFKKDEEKLADIARRTPIGSNATVLEYEGHWLRRLGLFKKAEKRLMLSNRIDNKRLGPFQVLLQMYKKLGDKENYDSVLKACLDMHKKGKCLAVYVPIKLHSEYFRNKLMYR